MKLNIKDKKNIIALFLVMALVNITPASAMSIGDINNQISSDIDTYNGYNWWQKLWHTGDVIASLFNIATKLTDAVDDLKNQALNAQTDASKQQDKLNSLNSAINQRKAENQIEAEKRDKLINDTNQSIQENKKDLEIDNQTETKENKSLNTNNQSTAELENNLTSQTNKQPVTNPTLENHSSSNINQSNKNNLNKSNLNQSTKSSQLKTASKKKVISNESREDANKFVKGYFKKHNVDYTELELSSTELKNGYIVQLFKDEVFKYWVFEGYTSNGKSKFVNLTTGNGASKSEDIMDFADSFTCLAYHINDTSAESETPYHAVRNIQKEELNSLDSLQNKIKEQTDWGAAANYILISGGGISGLGFAFGAACALLSVIFGIATAATATVVLGIPMALIIAISGWGAVITGILSVILLAIWLPLTIGGGIALGECNRMNAYDAPLYNRLVDDYKSNDL